MKNLEALWLNNNKLTKINNLDANIRIKALYAQVGLLPCLPHSVCAPGATLRSAQRHWSQPHSTLTLSTTAAAAAAEIHQPPLPAADP